MCTRCGREFTTNSVHSEMCPECYAAHLHMGIKDSGERTTFSTGAQRDMHSGEKTVEVRKTRPKLETPFKCYIYCTKAEKQLITILRDGDENYGEIYHGKPVFIKTEKGSVCDMYGKRQKGIGEFVCDDIFERIVQVGTSCMKPKYCLCDWNMDCTPLDGILSEACMTSDELEKYLNGGIGYGWHISDLKIYDTPRELSEFTGLQNTRFGAAPYEIKRAPQSWCYVEEQK